jgi:hypothetical protein
MKFRVFWDVLPCSQVDVDGLFRGAYWLHHQGDECTVIALMMEASRTSETSVNNYLTTWQYIPEDSKPLTGCDMVLIAGPLWGTPKS